ncbi:O-antigen ligase family protein [Patescibacteria group bacterium]|nr:O-antigen ligase family protein [Patescibacteria group bacterium]MBU0963582.1 O-antigen ligase family protein [Patescibacteria group bacterium]
MIRAVEKIVQYGFYLLIFLLPWQTRWIWQPGLLNGGQWEYGSFSIYLVDILLIIILIFGWAVYSDRQARSGIFRLLLTVFFFFCFFSVLQSDDKNIAWYAVIRLLAMLLLVWFVLKAKFKWHYVGAAFIASGLIQSVMAIYQFFSQQVIASKWLGLAEHRPDILGDFVVEASSGRFLRAYGSFPHPNMLAGFLVIVIFVLLGFLIQFYKHRQKKVWQLVLFSGLLVLNAFALLLTFSRSALLFFILVFFINIAIYLWKNKKLEVKVLSRAAVWLLLVAIASFLMLPELWQTRINVQNRLEAMSLAERTESYEQAGEIILDKWYQGTGIGTYTKELYDQNSTQESWSYQPIHNIYVLAAAEAGIFGGFFLIIIGIEFFRRHFIYDKKKFNDEWMMVFGSAFFTFMLIGLLDHYLWTLSAGILMFWLVFALWLRRSMD